LQRNRTSEENKTLWWWEDQRRNPNFLNTTTSTHTHTSLRFEIHFQNFLGHSGHLFNISNCFKFCFKFLFLCTCSFTFLRLQQRPEHVIPIEAYSKLGTSADCNALERVTWDRGFTGMNDMVENDNWAKMGIILPMPGLF
jgi:hypothetical protein